MPPVTRAQAAKSLIIKKRTAQMLRVQKLVHGDGPFRGTRSGWRALPPLRNGDARQPEVDYLPEPNVDTRENTIDNEVESIDGINERPITGIKADNIKQEIERSISKDLGATVKTEGHVIKQEMDDCLLNIKTELY
ncbi:hypothetical protein BDR07DRAFT_1377588 [Suillus spraguei]|nr:hypothetical protein BDR07DRAFT_1377588 [Suillus spraguei]